MDGANALEQNVLLPMSELGQCNKFHQDMLLDMVDSQHNIIHGTRNAQVTEEYKELTPAAVVSMGLIKAIEQLNHNQEKLKERVANIRETFVEQKELAERNLLIAMSQKTKVNTK